MGTKISTRAEAIFRALLADEHTAERHELFAHGVGMNRIELLYPYGPNALPSGLRAYMAAGGRIVLDHPAGVHAKIAEENVVLDKLFSHDQIAAAAELLNVGSNYAVAKSIVGYSKATFSEITDDNAALGSHHSQAANLVIRLMWAMVYARQPVDLEASAAYLGSLVDTYLPDLLGKR